MLDDRFPPPTLHLPYEAGVFRMSLGLTAIAEHDWIEADSTTPGQIATRARLLAERRGEVLAEVPGAEAPCAELRAMLAAHLAAHRPGWVAPSHDPAGHPLADICPWVAEDFCLLRPGPEGPVLIAAILCFPSRWRLSDKIGRPMAAIHKPVPTYAETLGRPVDRFMAALKPGRLVVRFNWSLHDDPTLFQPTGHGRGDFDPSITAGNAGETLWLRVERQTLRLLPESGAIVFGIRTHVTPLAEIAALPGEAARLAAAVRGVPPEMERYKSLMPYRTALLAYLDGNALNASSHKSA
jgi:dimethylamine monooxygenase subunit A